MPITLPNMSLVAWTNSLDTFSHTDLANNFTQIDSHDHTTGKGVQIPAGGLANLSVGTSQMADGAITDGKVSAISPITDAKIASPNNPVYRTIGHISSKASSSMAAGNYLFAGASGFLGSAVASSTLMTTVFYLNVNDYTVANKSPVLQVLVTILINNVAPGITYTVGLNTVSVNSGTATSGNMAYLLGSQVPNSTAQIVTPAQNTSSEQASVDFAFPASAGFYTLGLNVSGTAGAGNVASITGQLRIRHT